MMRAPMDNQITDGSDDKKPTECSHGLSPGCTLGRFEALGEDRDCLLVGPAHHPAQSLIHGPHHHGGRQAGGQHCGGVVLDLEDIIAFVDCVEQEESVPHTEEGGHTLG